MIKNDVYYLKCSIIFGLVWVSLLFIVEYISCIAFRASYIILTDNIL